MTTCSSVAPTCVVEQRVPERDRAGAGAPVGRDQRPECVSCSPMTRRRAAVRRRRVAREQLGRGARRDRRPTRVRSRAGAGWRGRRAGPRRLRHPRRAPHRSARSGATGGARGPSGGRRWCRPSLPSAARPTGSPACVRPPAAAGRGPRPGRDGAGRRCRSWRGGRRRRPRHAACAPARSPSPWAHDRTGARRALARRGRDMAGWTNGGKADRATRGARARRGDDGDRVPPGVERGAAAGTATPPSIDEGGFVSTVVDAGPAGRLPAVRDHRRCRRDRSPT